MSREFLSGEEPRHQRSGFQYLRLAIIALAFLALNVAHAQTPTYVLGTSNLLVGPAAGSNSVVLGVTPASAAWTNAANASWLHLSPQNQSGTGSTNIIFSYDANPGSTRTGTLTIAGQTLTVTQAGSTYVSAPGQMATLMTMSVPTGVAVDASGNVYSSDSEWIQIWKWTATNNTAGPLSISGLSKPWGVAVDKFANVYMVDYTGWAGVWTPANNSGGTLVIGLTRPEGVAVDDTGNVYIANTGAGTIVRWSAVSQGATTVISSGLSYPGGVAVDKLDDVYIADNGGIEKWTTISSNLTNLVSTGLSSPSGVAVDGSGNLYIADTYDSAIKEWSAASNSLTTLVNSGLYTPYDVAVDQTGALYIADTGDGVVKAFQSGFVDPTTRSESSGAGNDVLPPVLPTTASLQVLFAPTISPPSAESWLTITGVTNGVVSFSFATNSGPNRGATITLLGQTIPVFQASRPNFLNTASSFNGMFQFTFSNSLNSSFSVLSSTNAFSPLTNWTVIGTASNIGPNLFEFTDPNPATNFQRYYRVRSP